MNRAQRIRVYVASTFADMQAERDHLATVVFPQLSARCESRGIAFDTVDLRLGVVDETSSESYVLAHFAEEVDRCRPYFIGLLGEHYGWVPESIPATVTDKNEWIKGLSDKSVTEMEFQYGVLGASPNDIKAYVYLREPAAGKAPEARNAALRAAVKASGAQVREGFLDPPVLGELVLADFNKVIDEVFQVASRTVVLSPEEMERMIDEAKAAKAPAPPAAVVPAPAARTELPPRAAAPVAAAVFATPAPTPAPTPASEAEPDPTKPRIVLHHVSGSKANSKQEFNFGAVSEVLIGRDATSTVRYADSDDAVSRDHLRITQNFGDPNAFVLNAKGRNGTFINKVEVHGSNAIKDGDIVQVGRGGPVFRFEQFPKPKGVSEPEPDSMPILNPAAPPKAAAPSPAPAAAPAAPRGNETVERQVDVAALEAAAEEEKRKKPSVMLKDTTENMAFNPGPSIRLSPVSRSSSEEESGPSIKIIMGVLVVILIAVIWWFLK